MKSYLIGALALLTAATQTGCAALGIATLGMAPPKPIETATLPDGPVSGMATVAGNGNLSVSVSLLKPAYQTQYVREDIKRLVIGLVDLNHSEDAFLGYEGINEMVLEPSYHRTIAGTVSGGSHSGSLIDFTGTSATNNQERINKKRYLYYTITNNIADSSTRNVTFTNLKPGNNRYIVFAAAFVGDPNSATPTVAGFTQATVATLAGNPQGNFINTVPQLKLDLNRGLGKIQNPGGNPLLEIIEHQPTAE